MEMGLKRYSFACCVACKQIELREGLSLFAAFLLQSFLIMDPLTAKIWKKKSRKQMIHFPYYILFPELY